MKQVVIVGAGGFGREVFQWLSDLNKEDPSFAIRGFIDDKASENFANSKLALLSTIQNYKPEENDYCVLAIADPATKKRVYEALLKSGARFMRLIHPTALVGDRVKLGEASIICPYCVLTCDIEIGRCVTLNLHSSIGHDANVGDFSTLSAHCDVTGYVNLAEGVFMGSGASVIPGIKIGEYARIGARAAVMGPVKANTTVIGNPAKVFR